MGDARGGLASTSGLDKLDAKGDGMIFYPSGNVAVVICKTPDGQILTVMSDNVKNSQVLVCFDHQGVGTVTYKNGTPWLVVTMDGWSVSAPGGEVKERGTFPRKSRVPITCEVINGAMTVTFMNRQDISVAYKQGEVNYEWQCGELLRRTESYTINAVGQRAGKLELDVDKIRQRQAAVGSLYVPPGPHAQKTPLPGIGSLRATLRELGTKGMLGDTIASLTLQDARLRKIDTLPLYSSSSSGLATGTSGTSTTGGRSLSASALPDFGSPPLSSVQQHYMKTMTRVVAGKSRYQAKRRKLERMSLNDACVQVMGPDALRDTLHVLCLLADWSPVCTKIEPQLQAGWHTLSEAATANAGSVEAHIQVHRVDASEGDMLSKRYDFRSVPMFLMFYQGKLVWASNNIRKADELVSRSLDALTLGRKGKFLSDAFSFHGRDNGILDDITPNMSLVR